MGRTIRKEPVNKFKDHMNQKIKKGFSKFENYEDEIDEFENDELFYLKKRNIKKNNKWKRQKMNSADQF